MKIKLFFLSFIVYTTIAAAPVSITEFIKIDQFGYRNNDQKIALISDPQVGYNASLSFTPGTTYQIRDWNTDAVVYTGSPVAWKSGQTHTQSGDKVWYFDFSTYTTTGSYYVFDVTNNVGSYRFEINNCVYTDVLKAAMRMYYYQRCGTTKQSPFVDNGYADGACHIGTQQDKDCRLYNNTNVSTSKDLSGGWHDAGDYNKYVNFTWSALINLLLAYEQNPTVWFDNYGIPESGNGIPDILDEIKYEVDWLLKMQNIDGSVISVMGAGFGTYSPPSADNRTRLYGPATTTATYSAAGIFALAAIQFNAVGQTAYAATLQTAAINAWAWANANPNIVFYNSGILAAGEQELNADNYPDREFVRKISSAVFLYALTGTAAYKTYIENNYATVHLVAWSSAQIWEATLQYVMLYYAALPGATPSVKTTIFNSYAGSMETGNSENLPSYTNKTDAYMAFLADNLYSWGVNQAKGDMASMFLDMNYYNLNAANADNYKNAASGYLHYFHGVNPNSKTYLTNMGKYGAENSVTSIYHLWFTDGSPLWDEVGVSTYGPAPGFTPGGPNLYYSKDACCASSCSTDPLCAQNVTPPANQPAQKSYKDFNTDWPVNSFTVTEPGIYYQAAYIRILSRFCDAGCLPTTVNENDFYKINIFIYPNPATTEFIIKISSEINFINAVMKIYDMCGKEIKVIPINSNETIIERSELQNGIYFYRLTNNNEIIGNGKLVVQ